MLFPFFFAFEIGLDHKLVGLSSKENLSKEQKTLFYTDDYRKQNGPRANTMTAAQQLYSYVGKSMISIKKGGGGADASSFLAGLSQRMCSLCDDNVLMHTQCS